MQEEARAPKTARDALLIELIGDIGILHDQIKSLPEEINQATSGSIEIIANAVEEAEKTASKLSENIDKKKETVLADLKSSVNKLWMNTLLVCLPNLKIKLTPYKRELHLSSYLIQKAGD